MRLSIEPSLLPLSTYLLPYLLLNLLECLQEELFNIAPLIEYDLTERLDLPELPILAPHYLPQVDDLLLLLPDDLLVLIPDQLLLLLEVLHDLPERLLQHLDLALQDLDLLRLGFPPLIVLVNRT